MAFADFIERSLYNRKGYKYHTYQTEFENSIFILRHYGTTILKVDLDCTPSRVIYSNICSVSDGMAISNTLWRIGIHYYYICYARDLYYSPAEFRNVYLNLNMLNFNYNKIEEIIKKYGGILDEINKLNQKLSYYTVLGKADFVTECLAEDKVSEIRNYIKIAKRNLEISKKRLETIKRYREYYTDRTHIIGTLEGFCIIKDNYLIVVSDKLNVFYERVDDWHEEAALGKLLMHKKYSEVVDFFIHNGYPLKLSELDQGMLLKILAEVKDRVPAYYRKMLDNHIAHLTLLLI